MFFEVLKREREAGEGVGDVWRWLGDGAGARMGAGEGERVEVGRGWSRAEVAMELGGMLNARDRLGSSSLGTYCIIPTCILL